MKKILLTISVVFCISSSLIHASGRGYYIGDHYYYNDDNGDRYTSYKIGDRDYVQGTNGYSGYGYHIGDNYYYNDNY